MEAAEVIKHLMGVVRELKVELKAARDQLKAEHPTPNNDSPGVGRIDANVFTNTDCSNGAAPTSKSDRVSYRQTPTTQLPFREKLFHSGDVHPDGWTHEYSEGDRVVIMLERHKCRIARETQKSVWVKFNVDFPLKLKRKSNVERDLDH